MIIIAHDFDAEVLTTMVINKLQNGLKLVAVKAPIAGPRDFLEDIAIFTGGTLIGDKFNLTPRYFVFSQHLHGIPQKSRQ